MLDRNPLHHVESEQAVIGAVLAHGAAVLERIANLQPGHFFTEAHREIFATLRQMASENAPIDVITVAERIAADGAENRTGGLAYLGEIAANTPGSANVQRYAKAIVDRSVERELVGAAHKIIELVSGHGLTRDKLSAAQSAIMAITESAEPKQPQAIRSVLARVIENLEKRNSGTESVTPTGFHEIDEKFSGGLRRGNLVIIAGRPGMGKTAFAADIALNAASEHVPTLFMSMEMSDTELVDRMLASSSRVPLTSVLTGSLNDDGWTKISAGMGKLHSLPLFIDEQGGLTLFDIASKARSVKRKHGLGLLVIDYLQLATGDGDSRNQEIERISRGLKALAKELEIPVIVLSQLSRKVEERTNKRPMLSDLRDSGAIEQDADAVMMCYRDEYYNADSPDRGTAEIIIAKNRQGAPGTARLAYIADQTRFANLDPWWTPAATEQRTGKSKRGIDF